ncbi:hypothetical protein FE782_02450 [Paenibacillus antri]|uniref:YCII-related domain-containing protein n=1 Tax=Paenibacillus antri TaxID=2582848 RepID=A0A5R9GI94_9BACL|nr:YciI family protein [Paenibacillus antri]TLS54226.1 hypothetical protein FE782_02450 [Paenibacillus antri]
MKKLYVVFLPMLDAEKSAEHRQAHLDYLERKYNEGVLTAYGRFVDGWGGMLVYEAESEEEVKAWAVNDPYIVHNARTYEIHEWAVAKANLQR